MTNQSTIDKLIEMRLTSMSDAFINQLNDPKMKDVSFEDRFGLMVDIEYNTRKNNSLKRLIKGAGFDQPDAYIGDINYTSGRKLNRSLIERLVTCEYITEHRNLFITGATGSGKTYIACAFGMEACKQRYKTKYVCYRICCLNSTWRVRTAPTRKFKPSMPILSSSSLMNGFCLNRRKRNSMISWNSYTEDVRNHLQSSVPDTTQAVGTISSAVIKVPLPKLSLTASYTMLTRSVSFRLTPLTTAL